MPDHSSSHVGAVRETPVIANAMPCPRCFISSGPLKPRLCSRPRPHSDPPRCPVVAPFFLLLQSLRVQGGCGNGGCCLSGCRRRFEDKEYERLTKRGLAVGGREHDEELQRHNECQVVRNDGDVDDKNADDKHPAGNGDKHVK